MFEGFPYTNFHELNLDWIIKIAKDFLDQYTHIQEIIETGEQSILDKTDAGLTQLQEKADALETALQNLYNDYSDQMASQLADALQDLNTWYTQHSGYLDAILAQNVASFQSQASAIGQTVINSIPSDYTEVTNSTKAIKGNAEETRTKSPWAFFYGLGYFNTSIVWTELEGLTTLKIPCSGDGFVIISGQVNFMTDISANYRFTYEKIDGTKDRSQNSNRTYGTSRTDGNYEACAIGYNQTKYVYITVNTIYVNGLTIITDNELFESSDALYYPKGIYKLDSYTGAPAQTYFNESTMGMLTGSHAIWKTVRTGDKLELSLVTGISYYGSYVAIDGTGRQRITNPSFTVPAPGLVCIFQEPNDTLNQRYIPVNRFKFYAEDILGGDSENEYEGLNCVAFGTSLTYRSETTGGYLNFLPTISGMVIDNQGVGSGKIKMDILNKIRTYTGYANKRIAILEGFCNDFGYNASILGVYTDNTDATVCGCIRQALTYILTQNRNITIFLVLDPYGQDYNGVNSSSTAVNSAGMTQYQYYNEIEKIAESLGVIVIPLYKISGMSENTPQYFIDNIHPSTLGAMQTAYAIWAAMKQHYPNRIQ